MACLNQFENSIGIGRWFSFRVIVILFADIWRLLKSRNDKILKNKDISMDEMIWGKTALLGLVEAQI